MPAIKTILLCVDNSQYAQAAAEAGVWLSKKLEAQLQVLSVADARMLEGPWFADLSGLTGVQPFQSLVPQLRELHERKAQLAVEMVAKLAKSKKVKCQTSVRSGVVVDEIIEAERTAELVILGQRGEGFEATGEWLGTNVDRAIRKSIKPCLITPSKFRPIKSILVAYDGSEHANHALYLAFDFVKALNAKLTILTVENTSDEEEKSWALKESVDLAKRQEVKAASRVLHGSPEEKILEVAADEKFDLIVMGAYGHTRLRELVLGSVTSHVIRKSPVPVLLSR
jgi:nucleotide-binding universal stress UspA family protein